MRTLEERRAALFLRPWEHCDCSLCNEVRPPGTTFAPVAATTMSNIGLQLLVARRLEQLVSERQQASTSAKPLTKTVDSASAEIKKLMLEAGETEAIVAGYKVTVDPYAERTSISRDLLIQAGVPVETVDACTVTTYYEKIDVREYKGDAE